MKKVLLSWMMLLGLVGAANADDVKTYVPDEEFTSIEAIGSTPFAIVNRDEEKAIYNSDAQNLKYDEYGKAFSATTQSFYFVLESLADNADESVQDCYLLKAVKSDGTNVSFWGNSAVYLNAGTCAEGGFNGCFVLGNGDKMGTDIKYGGVWQIEYVEGEGFALKNKAHGGYFAGAAPGPTGSDPIYWSFCTLKEESIENPIEPGSYDATNAMELAYSDFKTIADGATWDADTKVFTKTCGWQWADGVDLSAYQYLVITAAQNRDGNVDGGLVTIKDKNGVVVAGDDYGVGNMNMWMSKWNHHNCCQIDLEKLRQEKMFDIYHVTELTIDGGSNFILGNVYATNTAAVTNNPWGQGSEGSFRVTGLAENQYGTVCLPYQAAVAGAYIYQVAGKTEDGVALEPYDGLLEAGVPYVYCTIPNRSNDERVGLAGNGVFFYKTTAATVTTAGSANGLIGTFDALTDGEYVVIGLNDDNNSELQKKANVGANQAYFDLEGMEASTDETALVYNDAEIEPEVDPGVKEIPDGCISIIENGTLDESTEVKSFEFITPSSGGRKNVEIVEGAGRAGSNGIKIVSGINEGGAAWDSQFWVRFNDKIPAGTKIHFEYDYRANKTATISTQQHHEPQTYAGGGFSNVTADVEWKHFEGDLTVSPSQNGSDDIESIAFNLGELRESAEYYFDNFLAYMEKPVAITEWVELVVPEESFVSKEQGMNSDPWLTTNEDGEVTVMSADGAAQDWDSQFFIKLSRKLPSGTKYKFSIDYKADKEAHVYMQSHNAPGAYKGNGNYGDFTCGNEYATHTKGTDETPGVTNDDGIWTIALNLCENKTATTFNFKNISFMVPADVYETLEEAPAATAKPEPSITIGSEYATFVPGYSMDISGNSDLVAYNVTYNAENSSVTLDETSDLPIGQAILLYSEDGAATFSDGLEIKRIIGAETGLKAAVGGDNPTKGDGSTMYVLADGTKGWGFYLLAEDVVIPAGKGYLVIEEAAGREFIGFADDATTVKALENLKKSGIIYNLAGQQVKSAKKGLYIIDGKKVMK